jgi:hypothetical protein
MSFLNLAALGFAALLPIIVLLYLLKLRRRPQVVPSTFFWQKAVEDMTANAPFQKLRRNLLMYLQLLLLALAVVALARPLMNLAVSDGRSIILLMDQSASMQTEEAIGTRFDEAIRLAETTIANMNDGDSMMLIAFGDSATLVSPFSRDQGELRAKLRSIQPTHERSNLTDAYLLAASLAANRESAEILVLSDGALEAVDRTPGRGERVPVRFVKVGLREQNVGFASVDLRQAPENPRDFQLFARVVNTGGTPVEAPLEVRNNGKVLGVRNVRIEGDSHATVVYDGSDFEEGTILLSLTTDDPLPVDDRAFLVLRRPERTRILTVGAANYFLEKAILFDRELNAEIVAATPAAFDEDAAREYDIVVFDSVVPPIAPGEELPPGNYLCINTLPPMPGFDVAAESIVAPPIVDWLSDHPIMRFVELADVAISRALDVTLPPNSLVLAETLDEKPLIAWVSDGRRNVVLYTFDIFDTNLPLRMAFPLLVSNTLHWLSQGKAATQAALGQTGAVAEVFAPSEVTTIRITTPDGKTHSYPRPASGPLPFEETQLSGFYKVEFDGEEQTPLAINLLNEAESNVRPRTELQVEGEAAEGETSIARVNTEVWRWFAGAALLLLLLEWWAYHKRLGL